MQAARARGHRVSALDADPDAAGFSLADETAVVDIRDAEACLAAARRFKPDAVLAVATEAGAPSAAFVAQALGLPGLSIEAARRATHKQAMREAFAAAGLASTPFRLCRSEDEALAAYQALGPRVVVKPVTGAGSRAVALVDEAGFMAERFAAARAAAPCGGVLVEHFMPGEEVAVEGYVQDGRFCALLMSDKLRSAPPALLDTSIVYPSRRPGPELDAITALAGAGALALGIDGAPVHAEIIVGPDGPRLVEIAARGAGFHVFNTIVPAVTGVDTVQLQLDLALGLPVSARPAAAGAARLDFPPAAPGRVVSVKGLEAVRAMTGVLFAECFVKPGDIVRPLAAGADRPAAIAVAAENQDAADALLARARAALVIETVREPVEAAS